MVMQTSFKDFFGISLLITFITFDEWAGDATLLRDGFKKKPKMVLVNLRGPVLCLLLFGAWAGDATLLRDGFKKKT